LAWAIASSRPVNLTNGEYRHEQLVAEQRTGERESSDGRRHEEAVVECSIGHARAADEHRPIGAG